MDSVLILTLARTWHPDKTTSSSKNLVLAVTLGLSFERKKKGGAVKLYYLKKIWMRTSSYSCFDFRPIGDIPLYKHFFSSLLRAKLYPGCQRLFMRGFRFLSSLKEWPARKVFSRGFAACVFGRRLKTCRPVADEAPRHTREKISGTQGRETEESYHKQQLSVVVRVSVVLNRRIHCDFIVYIFSH